MRKKTLATFFIIGSLRDMLTLTLLLLLIGLISACGTSTTSGSSPTPTTSGPSATSTSTRGIAGKITEFPLPPSSLNPGNIVAGPDGNLWFTEMGTGQTSKIGRITPTGTVKEFSLPTANAIASAITAGPDGNLRFFEQEPSQQLLTPTSKNENEGTPFIGKIGRITPSGQIREFPLPASQDFLSSITAGPDGNVWFAATGTNGGSSKIGVVTPQGQIREFTLPHAILRSITKGPDGALWFTEVQYAGTGQIGRITTEGKINEFPLTTPGNSPFSITTGLDHTLWSTERNTHTGLNSMIGHLT